METDLEKRLNALEDDFKLIKGEIRSTVMNVRDFVTELKTMPPREDPEAIDLGKSDVAPPSSDNNPLPPAPETVPNQSKGNRATEEPPYQAGPPETPGEEDMKPAFTPDRPAKPEQPKPREPRDELPAPSPEAPDFGDDMPETEPEQKQEELAEMRQHLPDDGRPEKGNNIPGVPERLSEINPLVNLIGWVARAKREVGKGNLTVLLDVYALGAPLSSDLRETIFALAETIQDDVPETGRAVDAVRRIREGLNGIFDAYAAEGKLPDGLKEAASRLIDGINLPRETDPAATWGRLILELHGILAGNEALFTARRGFASGEKEPHRDGGETPEPESPLKLKLVLPTGGGREREFVLNLVSPANHNGNGNGHNGNGNGKNGNGKNGNRNIFRN